VPPGGSIQAAHDALPATGGNILLAANTTYVVTTGITISKPNVTVWAPSWGTVLQRGASLGGTMFLATGAGCRIEGMTFDGNGAVNATGSAEVQLNGANSRITNCYVFNSAGTINIALGAVDCRADHNTVVGFSTIRGYGVWALNHFRVTIDHNTISNTGIDAIGADGAGTQVMNNKIIGCHTYTGIGGGAIAVYANTAANARTLVSGNDIDGTGAVGSALELNGNNISIIGNTMTNTWGSAMLVRGSGYIIADNHITNPGQDGNPTHDGIAVAAGCVDFVITGNRIFDTQTTPTMRYPISIASGASDNYTITSNRLYSGLQPTVPISDAGTGTHKVIANNEGLDDQVISVTSQATIIVPLSSLVTLIGSSTITAISATNMWAGRRGTFLPTGAAVFVAGATIANSLTCAPNVPINYIYDGTKMYLGNSAALPLVGGTVTGATTFSGAGTGLAVTNNATVGGTLVVTGQHTAGSVFTSGTGLVQAGSPAASQNVMRLTPGNAGTTPALTTVGVDTNVNLNISCQGTGGVRFISPVGFNNTAPLARPTIAGACAGNTAIKALLTALVSYGLITDTTSA